MDVKRHVCILCKSKKTANKMIKHRSHWTCLSCTLLPAHSQDLRDNSLRVLNLYCGIGGNRKDWTGCHITAIERDVKVAAAYKHLYPNDTVIVTDAHIYLRDNYFKFDVIWSSPPCQSHSALALVFNKKPRYPDLSLYAEIIFLRQFFKGLFVVENVKPFYDPLIPPDHKIGRHYFWSNFKLRDCQVPHLPGLANLETIEDKQKIMDWLGIYYEKNLYLSGKNYIQVFRNCVHPILGKSVWDDIIASLNQVQPAGSFPQVVLAG